jgi:hypothetical protein
MNKSIMAVVTAAIIASRTALVALCVALIRIAPAGASAVAPDQSDIWWKASESGWGMQLAHRGQVIFATVYLYDAQGKPTWITAALRPAGAAWVGDVYVTTGPWFGAPSFDANAVTRRVAGTMTWSSADATSGTITYSVDGVSVTKQMVRQPLDNDTYAGRYMGAFSWTNTCSGVHENFVDLTVTQIDDKVSVNWTNQATRDSCSMSGVLDLNGQFGAISGSFQCGPVHDDGEFTLYELRVTPEALVGRYQSRDEDAGCASTGYLSATRRR